MGLLDEVAGNPQQQPAQPASTQSPQGNSLLDQVASQNPPTPTISTPSAPTESLPDRWKREAYETVGKAVPDWSIAPMQTVQTHLLDKFHQMARETGNYAEAKVNTFLGLADDILTEETGGKHVETPKNLKGLEGAAARQRFESGSPITAGATGGLANLGGQVLGDPTNWPFLAKGLVKSVGAVSAETLKPWAEKLMSKGFGLQMSAGVVSQLDQLSENWDKMSDYDKSHAISQIIAGTYMSQSALREGFKGAPKPESPQTFGPEQGGEGPKTSTQTGTVAGEQNALRPTTRTTAGVEAPVTAKAAATLEGQKPSLLNTIAGEVITPSAETKFGKEQTAPAAARQAQSTVGQVAEDRIAQHLAVANGEAAPETITGTQQPSKFTSPDDAWQEMQKTAKETTFAKADDISQREQAAWEAKRDEAVQEYKDLVDRHNQNIKDYNAQVPADQRMPAAVFNPNEVAVPERPMSYNELRADVQKEQANAKSQDAAVREEAITKGLPKAEKAMDGWFKQHADEISPAEYDSVKKLWADSERMKEVAMGLRGPLTKGNLTGNQMRQIEVSMNNRQIRRGQSPDAFQRLLGPDGYNNWQNVAKLFDTVKDPSLPEQFTSWGKYAGEYLVAAIFPHILGIPAAAKWGMERLLNNVMFDPEFGSTFGKVVDWLKERGGVAAQSITELPATLRDKLVGIIKSNQDAGEKGMAGKDINKPRFGRKGLGAPAPETNQEAEQVTSHEANGGSTFSPEGQNLNGQNKYSVGAYPDRTQVLDNLTPEALKAFKDKNKDVLSQPEHAVGTWKDSDTGKHVLDVTKLYGDRAEAVRAGQAANQKAIYHLGGEGEIQTGGTGTVRANEPQIGDVLSGDAVAQHVMRTSQRMGESRPSIQDSEEARALMGLDAGGNYRLENIPLSRLEAGDDYSPALARQYAEMDTPLPPIVMDGDGGIRDGNHRVAAAKRRGDKTIEAYVPIDSQTFVAHHWSSVPNLTETNPEMMGTGVRGAERARMNEPGFQKRTNFGLEGYKEPAVQGKPYHYVANLDASKYYDPQADPDGIWQKGYQEGGATGAEKAVRDAGYHGYRIGNEVASFEKVPVKAVEAPKASAVGAPQPQYLDRKNGLHEVVTGPESDRIGQLTASDVPSEKEGEPSTEVRVRSHWVSAEARGKGFGAAQLETLAKSLPSDKTALLSDTKMTDSAKGAWKRLMANYPLAVTETPEGYRFDLEKLKAPSTTKTTATVKGSTVELMHNPLPIKATGETGVSTIDVAKALNKYTKRNLGALQPGSESAEMVARATELAEDEARYQLTQNNSGTTWYTEQMDEHDAVAKEMRPALKDDTKLSLFKFAEAILSSGQKPYRNFTATMEAWDHYARDGKFPISNPSTGKSWGPRGINAYGNAFDAVNRLVEERGEKGAVDWMMSEHPVSELKQYNKNVSGKKTDMQNGVQILGAKRGPFAQNLHGQETAFTADMWVSRTWNRWMGSIEVDPASGEVTSDAPRNQQERALMKQSFSDTAQKLGLTTSSLQAVLWYYEQALYTAHGTPKESWSFSDAARRAQAEEKAKVPEPAPQPVTFGPKPGEGKYRDDATEFNPEDLK